MSSVRRRYTRATLFSLALAALFVAAVNAVPASAAPNRPAAAKSCDTTPVFFGLHGMNEGPSLQISADSPELESFDTDQNAISGAVLTYPVSYTTVYPGQVLSVIPTTIGALLNGENALQADIKGYTTGCSQSQDKIALVGYSMGAWVINKWIKDHRPEWKMIKAVVLYGDPCWVHGNDGGLARLAPVVKGAGCMPIKDYPYPVAGGTKAAPFPVQSWTMPRDPVSGAGWGGYASIKNWSAQYSAAIGCSNPDTCSHLDYTGGVEIYQGAQFVVSKLVG